MQAGEEEAGNKAELPEAKAAEAEGTKLMGAALAVQVALAAATQARLAPRLPTTT